MPFLELSNIHASIDGTAILKDVSFQVEKGELLTLVGPSGCGKTTTLRLIAGFLEPDEGDIIIRERSMLGMPPYKRNVGIVFQDYALFPHLNVRDNIAFGLKMHGWEKERRIRRIVELLELVHLEGYGERPVTELSGGEKQRVALARALAPEPEVLLLDEPLSALDARLRDELRREIKRIQRELELTVVYVTHDQEEALSLSTVLGVMNTGRIEQIGNPITVYERPETLFTAKFLGSANLLKGRILGKGDEGILIVETGEGTFHIEDPGETSMEDSVHLFFRGEDSTIQPQRADGSGLIAKSADEDGNMILGKLEDLDFFGDVIRARVRGNGGGMFTLKVSPSQQGMDLWDQVGKEVVVRVERFGIIRD